MIVKPFINLKHFFLCIECLSGKFGLDCKERCSGQCANGEPCDHVIGVCHSGCQDGNTGNNCNSCKLYPSVIYNIKLESNKPWFSRWIDQIDTQSNVLPISDMITMLTTETNSHLSGKKNLIAYQYRKPKCFADLYILNYLKIFYSLIIDTHLHC